jgi:polar amino acid transport system substrate-binding protein
VRPVFLLFALLLCGGLAPSAGHAQDKAPLRIAVEGASPPFNFIDQNNELQGFELDLMRAICAKMGENCVPVIHEWDGIIRGLLNKEYDAIFSSLEVTERRQQRIAFSVPYYRVPAVFVGPKTSALTTISPETLRGLRIGVTDRTAQEIYLTTFFTESEIKVYAKLEEANLDLLTDRLDLVLGDKFGQSKFLDSREGACCRIIAGVPSSPAYKYQSYAVGLRKEDTELKARLDDAIRAVIADGSYDRIRQKYFSFDIK